MGARHWNVGSVALGPRRPRAAHIDTLRARARAFLDGAPPPDKSVGYRGHPDYAELGQLSQSLRLADALMTRSTTPAIGGFESLVW